MFYHVYCTQRLVFDAQKQIFAKDRNNYCSSDSCPKPRWPKYNLHSDESCLVSCENYNSPLWLALLLLWHLFYQATVLIVISVCANCPCQIKLVLLVEIYLLKTCASRNLNLSFDDEVEHWHLCTTCGRFLKWNFCRSVILHLLQSICLMTSFGLKLALVTKFAIIYVILFTR